jgi:thioesterase domain-containing protein
VWEETGQVTLSMQELASRSVAELQRVQPHGPYCIAGFCFGGVLAFEVAQQLVKQGEEVAFLGLLAASYEPGIRPSMMPEWLSRCLYHVKQAAVQGPVYISRRFRKRLDLETRLRSEWIRVVFTREIAKIYRSTPYAGAAVLLRAALDEYWIDYGPHNGWDDMLIGGLHVENIQCIHDEFNKEPRISEVAEKLDKLISAKDHQAGQTELVASTSR